MLYIIHINTNDTKGITSYTGFDTCSDSSMELTTAELAHIIKNTNIQVINASIQNDKIELKNWQNGISTYISSGSNSKSIGPKYTLLAEKENSMYKIVTYFGSVADISETDLNSIASSYGIANYKSKMQAIDIYKIKTNKEFIKSIESKYNTFIAKTALLGIGDTVFEYEIENQEVRLVNYIGSNRDVILPSFIASIKQNASSLSDIKTIKINTGLKVIGPKAFVAEELFGAIEKIEVYETVELICNRVFMDNSRLIKANGTIDTNRVILRNSKTIILGRKY